MQHPWLAYYPKEVPHQIDPDIYTSLNDLFIQATEKFSDAKAFTNMGTSIHFRELALRARDFASYLTNCLGLQKGDRVAIMMPNLLQYPIALFGILQAGLIVVNVNPLYTAYELIHILEDSQAKAVIILDHFASVLQEALPQLTSIEHIIVTRIGDAFPPAKRFIVNFIVKYFKRMIKPWLLPHAISFNDSLKLGHTAKFNPIETSLEDIAFLQYTGGTTGISKGTMLTHRNIIANILQMKAWINTAKPSNQQDILITPLPLYHIFSLTVNCLTFLALGGENILITNPKDIPGFIKLLKQTRFSAISGVNTLYNALMNHSEFSSIDFSSLRFAIAGGMALQRAVAERWATITKTALVEGYGLTEASPVVSANPLNILEYNGSIGFPFPSTEVSIRDEQGLELTLGSAGELWVRGPQVMKGYWNNPEETMKVLTNDGWLKTGDIARFDEIGHLYIVDRKKDMIIVSGFNVYPNEIEDAIAKHPGVLEVAVIGVPDQQTGERVKAFIVRKDPSLTAAQVIKYCRKYLTRYKVPHAIEFRDELPKTNVGKILRRALKEA